MNIIKFAVIGGLGFLVALFLFVIAIILGKIAKELRIKNKQNSNESAPASPIIQIVAPSAPAPVVAEPVVVKEPQPVVAVNPVVEEAVAKDEEIAVVDDTVTFSSDKTLTIDDKYLELTNEQKNHYDEIIKYASKVEGSRRFKNARYEEYKVGKNRLVRMLIKRGVIVCEFILPNNDFKNYVNENKLKIKSAPTVLKIVDAESVQVAKDSIDIAMKAIEEEKELKRQQTRERRKQARLAKNG